MRQEYNRSSEGLKDLLYDVKRLCDLLFPRIPGKRQPPIVTGDIESLAFAIGRHPDILNAKRVTKMTCPRCGSTDIRFDYVCYICGNELISE